MQARKSMFNDDGIINITWFLKYFIYLKYRCKKYSVSSYNQYIRLAVLNRYEVTLGVVDIMFDHF